MVRSGARSPPRAAARAAVDPGGAPLRDLVANVRPWGGPRARLAEAGGGVFQSEEPLAPAVLVVHDIPHIPPLCLRRSLILLRQKAWETLPGCGQVLGDGLSLVSLLLSQPLDHRVYELPKPDHADG